MAMAPSSSTRCAASDSSYPTKPRVRLLSIRTRLTLWFSGVVALIIVLLGTGIFYGASWDLQRAADLELRAGLDGVSTYLYKKLVEHDTTNLPHRLRDHSSLLSRGKMLRVWCIQGSLLGPLLYQAEDMPTLNRALPGPGEILLQSAYSNGKSYRVISRTIAVGQTGFLIEVADDESEYVHLRENLLIWLFLFGLPAGLLLAGLAGHWTSSRILIPLDRITETASAIDARNIDSGLPITGTNDELDRLSKTLNGMLKRIHASYEQIAQFTADASHELRTPIAHIRSSTELMLMKFPSSRMAAGLSETLAECDYMAELITDLLTLARADASSHPVALEVFELAECADAIAPRVKALAATKHITFLCPRHRRVAPVFSDRTSVQRVMMILLDNAVRYTPNGGVVSLELWTDEEECGFTVADTGIGLAPEHHQRIFERFYRVDKARTPQDGGSGLGLAIVSGLLKAHGARVIVESELGRGARFRIAFSRAERLRMLASQPVSV
jgi:signal transduction histidine kinase